MRAALLGAFTLTLMSFDALAEDGVGRYQAIAIPQPANAIGSGSILLLDTRDGQVWQWWQSTAIGNIAAGSGITYLGKLIPGTAPGEIVQRFSYGK